MISLESQKDISCLPPALRRVVTAYASYNEDKGGFGINGDLSTLLDKAQHRCRGYTSRNVQLTLASYRLRNFEFYVRKSSYGHLGVKVLDRFFRMINKHKLVDDIVASPENAPLLACLCLQRVILMRGEHPERLPVRDTLIQWSKRDVDTSVVSSLEAATAFLYGPACWSLYIDEVTRPEKLPRHLWHMRMALFGLQRNAAPEPPSLPLDIWELDIDYAGNT